MYERGVRYEKIMRAADAAGWRLDMLIEAQPYFDRYAPDEARGHLGFHAGQLQRLLTRDGGRQFCALRDLVGQVRERLSRVRTPSITIGCYCDYGTVESVGLTWFLLQVIPLLGYVCMQPIYMEYKSVWSSVPCQRGGAGACVECRPDADSEARRGLKDMLVSLAAGMLGGGGAG